MFNASLIVHIRKVTDCVKNVGAEVELNFDNFNLEISGGGKYFVLTPEFIEPADGYMIYQSAITPATTAFSGWRLSPRREYILTSNKFVFKNFCLQNNLRTPQIMKLQNNANETVLIKEVQRSGVRGVIEGPMRLKDVAANLADDGRFFMEQFIEGDTFDAWFWDGRLACVEYRPRPTIKSDGLSTLRNLVEGRYGTTTVTDSAKKSYGGVDWHRIEAMARWQAVGLDDVVPVGTQIVLDFSFKSMLHPVTRVSENIMGKIAGISVCDQLSKIGPVVWTGLQEQSKSSALFCVSGVVDSSQQVWLTDMDLGRYVHPDVYETIVSSMFGVRVLAEAPQATVPPSIAPSVTQH